MNKIVLSCVSLLLVGCMKSTQPTKVHISSTEPDEFPIVNREKFTCLFEKMTIKERIKCLKDPSSKIIGYLALAEIKGGTTKEQTIHLNGEKKLIILVDVWNVAIPINTASTPSRITSNKDYRVIEIDVSNIVNNKVVIFDNNHKLLMVLNIIK